MMTLRTAVVGGGTVSGVHLEGLTKNPRTELVAICDTDEEIARGIAETYDIAAYFDVEELLEAVDLDWLHICTPVQSHLPIAKLAIDAGVPIQIEKPMTQTHAEFEELAAYANEHGVTVSEKHNHNFDPAVRSAMAKRRNGELGDVRGVDVIYTGSSRPDDPNRGPWNLELSGGEFEEGIPHPLYLTLHTGGYPRSESAVTASTALYDEYEMPFDYDGAQVQYVTEDDVLCTTKMLGGTRPVRQILIHAEKMSLTVDLLSQTVIEHDRNYKSSAVTRALNNLDEASDRLAGTVANARAVAHRARAGDDWDTVRLLNAHFYQNDAESRALMAGDTDAMPVPMAESRWTSYLMEAIRDAATDSDGPTERQIEKTVGRNGE